MATQSSFILISLVAFLSCLTQGSSKLVVLEEDTSTPHRGLHVIDPPPNVDAGVKVVDIMHFGAKANGKDDDVKAFTQAWEEACHKGGGAAKLLIPEGKYLSSPVDFIGPCLGHITVEVRGTILASDDISTYKGKSWFQFKKIKGLVLTGGGTFDGRGATVWKNDKCNPSVRQSIVIQSVDDAVIHDICSMDSKFFHYHVSDSNNFKAYNLKITAPGDSPNTDGMHISSSNGVEVSNSFIGTGDDCISIGHGVTNANIFGITCGPGHGISIGSLGKRKDETDVTGITVSNCTLTNTTNGARIKTFASDIAIQAKDITFQDIIMNGVQNPIIIDQNYGSKKNNGVKVSNVHYKNIRGTTTSNIGIDLDCSSAEPCVGIEFCDVSLDFINTANPDSKKGKAGFTATCLNAKVTYQGVNKIPMCP
ncbi:Exopolygalacturonase clone GBGE184 [Linum perenne]